MKIFPVFVIPIFTYALHGYDWHIKLLQERIKFNDTALNKPMKTCLSSDQPYLLVVQSKTF